MTESQQPVAKFLQALTNLKGKIKPYLSSFKCALAYVVEIENRIAQLCIIFYSFEVDSSISPSVTILASIYARISRCDIVKDKIIFYVETVEALTNNPDLYVNILGFSPESNPLSLKIGFNQMKLSSMNEQHLCFLSYEMPFEGLERIELDLKDRAGISRSSCKVIVTWVKILQKKENSFLWKSILLSLKNTLKNLAFPLSFLIPAFLSIYAAWFYISNKTLPDPIAAVTLAMAIATLLMVYTSKKGLDVSQRERIKPLAKEALNEFLNPLKRSVEEILQKASSNEKVSVLPEHLEPKLRLLTVTYEESPFLLRKISKLLKAISSYNVSINPEDLKNLKTSAEEVLRGIDALETKLSQKYWVKPSSNRVYRYKPD